MFRWYIRYLPYALVVWLCRRNLERFSQGGLVVTEPFRGELIGWPAPPSAMLSAAGER